MDLGTLVTVGGAIVGQIAHIVKKKTEEDKSSEVEVFKKWIIARPANTILAVLGSAAAAIAVNQGYLDAAQAGVSYVQVFLQAFVTGIAGNSVLNRPGKES